MRKLINIDNGGTLTDVVVVDRDRLHRAKTLTTPFDLSQCFFDGLRKVSGQIYGTEDLPRLLGETDFIRYSTTEGTNALIQRRGPRLGLILSSGATENDLVSEPASRELFETLVGARVAHVDPALPDDELDAAVLDAVNGLGTASANRLVVSIWGPRHQETETAMKRHILRRFPSHLLGSLPVAYSHEVADDFDDRRRTWTALLNAFLHPSMEEFLYHAQHRISSNGIGAPLLIFRNDGGIARVAKTKAISSLSSGPRGGLDGVVALAAHYDIPDLVSIDVGGTSSDVGRVRDARLRPVAHGAVEGIPISQPLAELINLGVGGGSVVRVRDGRIVVGPDSVGAAPGPACFALGGTDATLTDAMLVKGVLDPATYLGGELALDRDRARRAIEQHVAAPLGMDVSVAVESLVVAWSEAVAVGVREAGYLQPDAVLTFFGGAGPMSACSVADRLGVGRVLIPGNAAVFSAVGIGFSDLSYEYRAPITAIEELPGKRRELLGEAEKDMFAEGVSLDECRVYSWLLAVHGGSGDAEQTDRIDLDETGALAGGPVPDADEIVLFLRIAKSVSKVRLVADGGASRCEGMVVAGRREIALGVGERAMVPILRLEDQHPGATARGPLVLEEPYFTAFVPTGWGIRMTPNRDIWLEKV
jgi:N-methylhydantoinase A/oxoprolinase/acetone carboxylase beta subunit